MEQIKSFEQFFQDELELSLQNLEAERQRFSWMLPLGLTLLIGMGILLLAAANAGGALIILPVLGFLAGCILLGIFASQKGDFVKKFKREIVQKIIHFVNPSFAYYPDNCINEADYDKSGLFLQRTSRYNGDDYIEGTLDKTTFCFSELHTQRKVDNGKTTSYETIFRGLFFIADFNKNFHGRTYAWSTRNRQLNFFNKIFSSFAWNLEKVVLESPDFAERFVVYSNDQVEARYILTPSFMERLMRLQQLLGDGTAVSFVDTNIYVAIPVRDELFEPTIFHGNSFETVQDYYTTVQVVIDIINELKLNQRIWNKD